MDTTDKYNPYPGPQGDLLLGKTMVVITGGGRIGKLAESLVNRGAKLVTIKEIRGNTIDFMVFDELVSQRVERTTFVENPKRKAVIAQLNRAKAQRNKNLIRDLTRQLEKM